MNNVKYWMLWCPTSNLPPRVKFFSEAEAEQAAKDMVERHNREFVVMEAKASFTKGKPKRTGLTKKAKSGAAKEVSPMVEWRPKIDVKTRRCLFCGSTDPKNVHASDCPHGKDDFAFDGDN